MAGQGDDRLNILAGGASVTVAAVLAALKFWALLETGALSIAASLADNLLDLMVSLGGLAALVYAARPPDEDHAFGHSSAEDLAALGQSTFITVSALAIGGAAALRLMSGDIRPLEAEGWGMAVMGISILLTTGLVIGQRRVARRTRSRVVAADALHYLSDLLPNIGAIVSLYVAARWGVYSLDSIVALIAAVILLFGGARIGKGAFDALMDRRADPALIAGIERIARAHPGVHGFHDLKTRTAGARVFVNLHIELDGAQTLEEAHAIGAALRRKILAAYPETDVIIHKDPVRDRRAATPLGPGRDP